MQKNIEHITSVAKKTFELEAEAIKNLSNFLTEDFAKAVQLIFSGKGRVIVTGIGKSANIATKIVATFNSTGTPSIFMHAADAIHGDLGIIQQDDVVICISKSGNTPEIKVLVPLIKRNKNQLIAIVSNADSFLAKQADFVLHATVEEEACPNNLAPTSSTTAQLVIGDALAICLLDLRGFTSQDFAKFHPGGALGKKLYMTVGDVFIQNEVPKVSENDSVNQTILEISSKCLGATAVLNQQKELIGIVTDGDLRRMLQKNLNINTLKAKDIMTKNPKTIEADELAINAFNIMEQYNITQLVVTSMGKYSGMVHLHDILKEGII